MEHLVDVLNDEKRLRIPFFKKATSCLVISRPQCLLEVRDQTDTYACVPFSVTACMYADEVLHKGYSIEASPQELHDHIFFHKRPNVEGVPPQGPFEVPETGFLTSFRSALTYIVEYGLSPKELYPWVGGPSRYRFCSGEPWDGKVTNQEGLPIPKKKKIFIEDFWCVPRDQLNGVLDQQPVMACIPLTKTLRGWKSQKIYEGEINAPDKGKHAITLVGYGQEGNDEYFIAQNSWGLKWGFRGYFKLKRDLVVEGRTYIPKRTGKRTRHA